MSLVELFQMSLAYGISLFISIKNFLLRFFGPFHTVYFLQDGKRKNITIQYLMGFIKDDGIYCIHTKYEGGETAIVISGDINYVDDYIDKFTMPIIEHQEREIFVINHDDIQLLDHQKYYINHFHYNLVHDVRILLIMLFNIYCNHIDMVSMIPFQRNTFSTDGLSIDALYKTKK